MNSTFVKNISAVFFVLFAAWCNKTNAFIPRPDHVVICMLENHSYQQIVGSPHTPYINSLVNESANLQKFFALTHPSQPNYLMMFSGSDQGETTDNLPVGTPWTTPNLGASLINSGFSFIGYSEDLPATGSTVAASGAYARKHSPWVNWQGTGLNQIPVSSNLSFADFPSDFDSLPDVSFVIPNQDNDMHNGSDPDRIAIGDQWIEHNLKPYIDWAWNNNSLFILTFDEDNFTNINHIMCLFIGPMVRRGNYYMNNYNFYDLLRTLEDMYNLPNAANSAFAMPISEIWMTPVDVPILSVNDFSSYVYPNPLSDNSLLIFTFEKDERKNIHLLVYDALGRVRNESSISFSKGLNSYPFEKAILASGIYTYVLRNEEMIFSSGKIIVE